MVKTLGQIAKAAFDSAPYNPDETWLETDDSFWEAAAQAVREAVIEECAKRIENEYTGAIAYSGKWQAFVDDAKAEVNRELVASIRALKDKK